MKKDVSVFTMTRNEPVFLRIWCNYYADYFPHEDIYVLDNSTSDGSIDVIRDLYPKINVISVPNELSFDAGWMRTIVTNHQKEILMKYNVVLFSETDEYLIHDNESIYDYCVSFMKDESKKHARATGFAPVHQMGFEPNVVFEPGSLVLKDRSSMWRLLRYDKTLIIKEPLQYCKGYHEDLIFGIKNHGRPREPGLSLLHAWQIDVDYYHQRYMMRTLEKAHSDGYHGMKDIDLVKRYFKTLRMMDGWSPYVDPENGKLPVPECWKLLLRF